MKRKELLMMILLSGGMAYGQNTCSEALTITEGLHTIDYIDGTEIPDPVCALNGPGAMNAEWYRYVPDNDYTVTVSSDLAANTGRDTRVHVYTGTCGQLTCVAGDDDAGAGVLSVTSFTAEQGEVYYIAWDNKWESDGFIFELTETILQNPVELPVTFTGVYIPTISGSYKIAIGDMNGDYLDDIVTVSSGNIQVHYQQAIGGFTNTTIATAGTSYLPSWSMAIADYDKNGFNDLLYGGGSGVAFLKANETGTEYEVIAGPQYVFSQRSNFVDINNDGNLDAFVCHDVDPNVYYINDGSGNLSFNQGGIGDHPDGGNYGSVWIDYDNDGDQDLFIAKCRGGSSSARINELHRNNGDGTFTDVSIESNLSDPVQTWSSAWNDFDNDGDMDVVVGASSTADGPHKFMRNNGDGTFTDITAGSGWDANTHLNIEHITFDFNNDGFADVFGGGNVIMFNNGDMTFSPYTVPMVVGAVGDLNNDGFLDVQNGNNIYLNDGNENNWIKMNLEGVQSNRNGIGARIEIYGDWGRQIRDVQSGTGFRYCSTLNPHFGLGLADEIDSVVVRWPSGLVEVICTPEINSTLYLLEGAAAKPVAELSVSANDIPVGGTIIATDESTECPNGWEWEVSPASGWAFINGTDAATQHPEIQFNEEGIYFVSLVAENSNGTSTNQVSEEIHVGNPTAGVTELNSEELVVFPNPVTDMLSVQFSGNIDNHTVSVYSLIGAEVMKVEKSKQNIDVSKLPQGTYFLSLTAKDGSKLVRKFVKY